MWRKIEDSPVFQNEGLLKVFLWCLIRASYKETFTSIRTGRGFSEAKLSPGSFIFGRESAAKQLHMSPSTVWKRILKLKKLEILNIESNSHYSIIYIINWTIYQAISENGNIESDRQGTGKEHKQEYKERKNNIFRENALEVLSYLNQKTGKHYRDPASIEARLKDGGTVNDCRTIIDKKSQDPYFIENPKYLNPRTLFRKSHWDVYLNDTPKKAVASW
jgi:uncharacterized phage protein (TIGR02220 family)